MSRRIDSLKARMQSELSITARYGIVVLFLLLASYFLLSLNDEVSRLSEVASDQAETLALLSDPDAETVWAERLDEAESVSDAWLNRLWEAASPGVGAAEIEVALRELIQSNAGEIIQIDVSPNPTRVGEVDYISYSLSVRIPATRIHQMLAQLGTTQRILTVTDLQAVAQRGSTYSLKIDGFAPFALTEAVPG